MARDTPLNLIEIRSRLGLSQMGLARFLRTDRRTVQAWEYGERDPPHATVMLLRWLVYGEKPELKNGS